MDNITTLSTPEGSSSSDSQSFYKFLSYISLVIIGVGFVGNSISFAIFRFHPQFKTMPSMVYLSFITITDSFSLVVWNLDHFILPNYGFKIEFINELACKILIFEQFVSLQASALLLSLATIDRYFTVIAIPGSFASKLPFRTLKTSYTWSISIIAFVLLLNLHVLLIPRAYDTILITEVIFQNATFNLTIERYSYQMECYSYVTGYQVSPNWENIHMIIYNLFPFCVMTIFNGLLIKNVLMTSHISLHHHHHQQQNTNNSQAKAQRKKRSLTIALCTVTVLFLAMTLPSSIMFGFFYNFFNEKLGGSFLLIVDYLSFSNSSSIFFVSFGTNVKFRRVVLAKFRKLFSCDKKPSNNYLVKSQAQTTTS